MLISESSAFESDFIRGMIAELNGNSPRAKEIQPGVYVIGHFGSTAFLREYEHYPELSVGPYGVCDDAQQLLDHCPELLAPGRFFIVTLTPVIRENQPPVGGWRWCKWGQYIGMQNPEHEYLYNDTHIDRVFCYHIYERK